MVEYLGNTSFAYVDTPHGPMIVESGGVQGIHSGDAVGLSLASTRRICLTKRVAPAGRRGVTGKDRA